MATTRDAPADTTMMSVVHDAFRRDLTRAQAALAQSPPPNALQREAIGGHLEWMVNFLHHHHAGEDDGLWPLVLEHNPAAATLLDQMDAGHQQIAAVVPRVIEAAHRYTQDGSVSARENLAGALDDLSGPLLDHLRAEEDDAMPVVSASISDAEWKRWDQEHNVRGKSVRQLADEGHWLMDGLDRARYQVLIHLVPAPVRFVIIKGFARRYRTAAHRRWGAGVPVGPLT